MTKFLELFSIVLAVVIGFLAYKKLNHFFKIIWYQVAIYFLVDVLSMIVEYYHNNNHWVYNLFMPFETALLCYALKEQYQTPLRKILLRSLYGLFLLIYLIDVTFVTGFFLLAYHAAIAEGLLIAVIYLELLFSHFVRSKETKINAPIVLSSLGMILYFACTVPIFSLAFKFIVIETELNNGLFESIVVFTAWLRYFCIAISFLMLLFTSKEKTNFSHD